MDKQTLLPKSALDLDITVENEWQMYINDVREALDGKEICFNECMAYLECSVTMLSEAIEIVSRIREEIENG